MKTLFIICSLLVASTLCDIDESNSFGKVACVKSRIVVEVKPGVTYFRIVEDSGETLLDVNSNITKFHDFETLLTELSAVIFPEDGHRPSGFSSDYYIISKPTLAGNAIKLVSKPGTTVFRKVIPAQVGPQLNETRCARIHGYNLTIDPAFGLNQYDGYNMTALLWSSIFSLNDLTRSLVARGANVHLGSAFTTPADQILLVRLLIQKVVNLVMGEKTKLLSPDNLAVYMRRLNSTRKVIDNEIPVDVTSNSVL